MPDARSSMRQYLLVRLISRTYLRDDRSLAERNLTTGLLRRSRRFSLTATRILTVDPGSFGCDRFCATY
jgi:hypothetical protein